MSYNQKRCCERILDNKMENHFSTVITSKHRLLDLKLKDVFKYRDLVFLFVKRDFVSRYKQTILGPLWAIIQPLLTTVVFTIVFGKIAKLTTLDVDAYGVVIPSFLFYMAGNICWGYFSSVVSGTSNTFIRNSGIMGKVYFPRMVMPISTALSNLISFVIQFAMFLVIWAFYLIKGGTDIHVSAYAALLPILILQMMFMGMGFGIIISSLTTKYRDLAMLVGFGLQLWHYATPVAYGMSLIPDKYMWLYMLNPITPVITTFRYAFFGIGYFNTFYFLLSCGITAVVLFIGLIMFNKIEKTFMDTV